VAIVSHVAFVANVMGVAGVAVAVSNTECMLLSIFAEPGFYNGTWWQTSADFPKPRDLHVSAWS
jgi:hypothetical protein